MIFTEEHLRMVIAWAIYRTSLALGIIGRDDTMALEDAVKVISQVKGHKDALDQFVDAYGKWYSFHLEIYKAGRSGQLSQEETEKLNILIVKRDNEKKYLLDIM